jgi:hypothetical protein
MFDGGPTMNPSWDAAVRASSYLYLLAQYQSAVRTLQDIAAMGKTKGCESARHRLIELGEEAWNNDQHN